MNRFDFHPDNMGGLLQIYAVPPQSFVRIREDYAERVHHLELSGQEDIIELPVIDDSSYSFSEELISNEAGEAWQVEIECFAPFLDRKHSEMIHQLERGIWFVLALDANGVPHWCGQQDAFMICRTSKSTGQKSADRNGTSITFMCVQDEPTLVVAEDYNIE